ncbi:hypothetical protein NA57DRAFT_68555 [Rhizodiscina lignyota]|uniref:Uncharacterized protein n=1 Tax=Rhizodiscina lignyota TaxID=1504668 RepID=A0A9P4I7S7_9PEZI|nr:hypothetical protein NA57DRAFT_68555 [Rhizodiscina lignyota]
MSNFYYRGQNHISHINNHQHQHQHHGGRSRRAHRQVKAVRTKEVVETVQVTNFRRDFEAARSFEIEDDEIFCPFNLLTEDDLQSISSSGSDRSSLSSGSPEHSPLQHQLQPTPSFVLSSAATFTPSSYQGTQSTTKIHQPLAQRQLKAIPIVDPSTRAVASPPPSVSPARQMQQQLMNRRW